MAKYFKNVSSFENLKSQYKGLLKENHPDNGGDTAKMQEINVEYDALFKIWKDKHEEKTGEKVQETAESTRLRFYTEYGWEGKNHDWNRDLKEIAKIVRAYVKEKYPTYKFSVQTEYASMCKELHVNLKESPIEIYKSYEEMSDDDKREVRSKLRYNHIWNPTSWTDAEEKEAFENAWEEDGNFYRCLNEVTREVISDVDNFVNSYNYEDIDSMIDYFHVDFYYFGCAKNNGMDIKVVPKTARIKNKETKPAKTGEKAQEQEKAHEIEQKHGYTYKITHGEDTRDGSALWVVRIAEALDKNEYIAENIRMKELGGYYSKLKHGFIFRFDPTEKLSA